MIQRPTPIVDEQICRTNIRVMAEKARANKVLFRPHFKTHQSHEIGNWFRDEGVDRITVSSLSMARYFAEDGWNDITVAFPTNVLEIETINELAHSITLNLVVESRATALTLSQVLEEKINLYIKLDIGYHRTGVSPGNLEEIDQIIEESEKSELLKFSGFLGHAGHSYAAKNSQEIAQIHEESTGIIVDIKERYIDRFPDIITSVGDTPTCSTMDDFTMADEIRPGNFVFYDLMQCQIGSCTTDQIALAMACPVVALHADRNEIIIYGGGVHFSKDLLNHPQHGKIYGQVVRDDNGGWGEPIDGVILSKISQEHGTINAPPDYIEKVKVGDLIKVLPVHSCMTANLHSSYLTTGNREISRISH